MAKKTPAPASSPAKHETSVPEVEQASPVAEPQIQAATDALAGTRPPMPRPPQGIVFGFMSTGDPRKDLHPRWKHVRKIDPKSLVVDGLDPYLALPIEGDPEKVRVRQVKAEHAAELLTCDPATGGRSIHRLATDDEVEACQRDADARAAKAAK